MPNSIGNKNIGNTMNDANSRQQIVDSIKNNNNVLVTVSTSPTVDELSAALGLTILLNNLGKRGTAVVSGTIPPAIEFLEPEKTFENTTDSLRDFIIALDKEKADHLRYKVEGDVVKIFITPYRTQLSEGDLEFSLGDFNVEVVIALGVKDQDHLDKALDAQGAILHDATVVTLTAGTEGSVVGSINWQDQTASSLCEMLVSLSEALKEDKPLLDVQSATAFLTGIVSATDRFSNDHTTSRVMTMAAQLMAAGANQQLIAAKLEEAHEIGPNSQQAGGDESITADVQTAVDETASGDDMMMSIDHAAEEVAEASVEEAPVEEVVAEEAPVEGEPAPEAAPAETAEETLARELAEVVPPAPEETVETLNQELEEQAPEAEAAPQTPEVTSLADMQDQLPQLPSLDFEEVAPKTTVAEPAPEVAPVPPPPPPPPPAPAPAPEPAVSPLPPPPSLPPLPPVPDLAPTPPPAPSADITAHAADNGYVTNAPSTEQTPQQDPDAPIDPFNAPMSSATLPPLQPDPLFAAQHASTAPVAPTITPPHLPDQIDYEETTAAGDIAATAAVPDFAALNPTGLASPQDAEPPSLDNLPPLPPVPDLSVPPPPDLSLPSAPAADTPPAAPPAPGQFKIPGQ